MGTYERYEPPSGRRAGLALSLILAVLAVGIAGWLLISERSKHAELNGLSEAVSADPAVSEPEASNMPPPGTPVGPEASPYAKDGRIAELEMQLKDKDFALSRQRSEIASLEARVGQLQEDSERYRAGLDQAVAELNQLRGEIGRLEMSPRATPLDSAGSRSTTAAHPVGAPYVTISPMGFVTVTGFVNNPTRYAARGKLEVSLVGSAGVIETRDFLMDIPPNQQERYDITFPGIFPTERIAAQAKWIQ